MSHSSLGCLEMHGVPTTIDNARLGSHDGCCGPVRDPLHGRTPADIWTQMG